MLSRIIADRNYVLLIHYILETGYVYTSIRGGNV